MNQRRWARAHWTASKRPLWSALARFQVAALVLGLVVHEARPSAAQAPVAPQGATVTAAKAARGVPMPTLGAYGFEIPFALIPFPPPTPPFAQWGPWTAYGTSGITPNGSALLGSLTAPQGTRVGYVSGDGRLKCTYTFDPGIWRLRYRGGGTLGSRAARGAGRAHLDRRGGPGGAPAHSKLRELHHTLAPHRCNEHARGRVRRLGSNRKRRHGVPGSDPARAGLGLARRGQLGPGCPGYVQSGRHPVRRARRAQRRLLRHEHHPGGRARQPEHRQHLGYEVAARERTGRAPRSRDGRRALPGDLHADTDGYGERPRATERGHEIPCCRRRRPDRPARGAAAELDAARRNRRCEHQPADP